jgi:hypothetical protein
MISERDANTTISLSLIHGQKGKIEGYYPHLTGKIQLEKTLAFPKISLNATKR